MLFLPQTDCTVSFDKIVFHALHNLIYIHFSVSPTEWMYFKLIKELVYRFITCWIIPYRRIIFHTKLHKYKGAQMHTRTV